MEQGGLGSEGGISSMVSVIVLTSELPSTLVLLSQMTSASDPVWWPTADGEFDWKSNGMVELSSLEEDELFSSTEGPGNLLVSSTFKSDLDIYCVV